jgi:hypothetical protein
VYRIFDAVRIGQITGATGPTWKHLTDPVGHPLLTDTGRFWNAIGIDLGANAEHSDGRLYFFTGDVATDQSGNPPDNSDMVAWTAEPEVLRNGGHLLTDSWDFQLPRSGPNVHGQPGWQFCMRCCALFYTLGAPAACSLGGTHDTYGLSWDLSVPVEPASEGQNQWRFCTKCHQLFYKGGPINGCAGGGDHDDHGSWAFVLPVRPGSQGGQSDWRYCANCHCLFFNGWPTKGICSAAPGGGIHLNAVTDQDIPNARYDPFHAAPPTGYLGSNETPGAVFSFDGRMYVFGGVAPPGPSTPHRDGDPQPGNYLFSKTDPSKCGAWDIEFLLAPELGWCVNVGRLEPHAPLGLHFLAVRNIGEQPHRRNGFRMCHKCEALFYADGPTSGVCAYDGLPHQPDDALGDFSLEINPAEDAHNQTNWKICQHCALLFWSIDAQQGRCAFGGQHVWDESDDLFRVPHDIPIDDHLFDRLRFCVRCHGLVRTDQTNWMVFTSATVVDNATHPVLQQAAGQGLVMIAYDFTTFNTFSLVWMPLFPGQRPQFETIRYYHRGKDRWTDVPDRSPGYELFSHPFKTYTHVSATWRRDAHCWVVLYGTASSDTNQTQPMVARFSTDLVRWSDPQPIFDPLRDAAYSSWMHDPSADHISDIPPRQAASQKGWAYGGFIVDRYTKWYPQDRILQLVYTLSTGAPYQIQLMETLMTLADPVA